MLLKNKLIRGHISGKKKDLIANSFQIMSKSIYNSSERRKTIQISYVEHPTYLLFITLTLSFKTRTFTLTYVHTLHTSPATHFSRNNSAFFFSGQLCTINGSGVTGDVDHTPHKFSAKGTVKLGDLWDSETACHKQIQPVSKSKVLKSCERPIVKVKKKKKLQRQISPRLSGKNKIYL